MDQTRVKSPGENMNQEETEGDIKVVSKRAPAPLTLVCGVCSAPAPDHLHFGGENTCTCTNNSLGVL